MALSVSVAFFFGVCITGSLWVRVQYKEARKSERRNRLLIQALRSARS